jgi:hypothetical protein
MEYWNIVWISKKWFFSKITWILEYTEKQIIFSFQNNGFCVFRYSRNFRENQISKYFEEFSKIRLKFEFRKNWTWIHKKIIFYIFRKFLWEFSKFKKILELFSKFLGFRKKPFFFITWIHWFFFLIFEACNTFFVFR